MQNSPDRNGIVFVQGLMVLQQGKTIRMDSRTERCDEAPSLSLLRKILILKKKVFQE